MALGSVMRLATAERVISPTDMRRIESWSQEIEPEPVVHALRAVSGKLLAGDYGRDCNAYLVTVGRFSREVLDEACGILVDRGWRSAYVWGSSPEGVFTLQLWP